MTPILYIHQCSFCGKHSSTAKTDTWENTAAELTAITYEMDCIHVLYSGKENKAKREELLQPLRKKCVAIGMRRQTLITKE